MRSFKYTKNQQIAQSSNCSKKSIKSISSTDLCVCSFVFCLLFGFRIVQMQFQFVRLLLFQLILFAANAHAIARQKAK